MSVILGQEPPGTNETVKDAVAMGKRILPADFALSLDAVLPFKVLFNGMFLPEGSS